MRISKSPRNAIRWAACSGLAAALFLAGSGRTWAQTPPAGAATPAAPEPAPGAWKIKLKAGLGLTQSSFSRNWAGTETGTISWLSLVDGEAEKQLQPRVNWRNVLVLNFGQTHQQDAARDNWLAPTKSADKIDYQAILRYTLGAWVDPYTALALQSQFFDRAGGRTKLFTPLLLTESAGVARVFSAPESRRLASRLGFAFRQRFDPLFDVRTPPAIAKRSTNDGGFESVTNGRLASAEDRSVFKSELRLYKAVFFSDESTDPAGNWKAVDVDWQNIFSNKLNKLMSVDLYLELLYDKQVRKGGQLKQTLGIGLSYQFI